MPGRDMACFWQYGRWYMVALAWVYLGTSLLVQGHPLGVIPVLLATGLTAFTVRGERRYRRSETAALRAAFLALVKSRHGMAEGWLNRDEHVAFTTDAIGPRWLRCWLLSRADEDQARELEVSDRVALTADMFRAIPVEPGLLHHAVGAVAMADGHGGYELRTEEGGTSRWRYLRRHWQAERSGLLHVSADEARELIRQFRDAEPITVDPT